MTEVDNSTIQKEKRKKGRKGRKKEQGGKTHFQGEMEFKKEWYQYCRDVLYEQDLNEGIRFTKMVTNEQWRKLRNIVKEVSSVVEKRWTLESRIWKIRISFVKDVSLCK
jgi:hypothetical protein